MARGTEADWANPPYLFYSMLCPAAVIVLHYQPISCYYQQFVQLITEFDVSRISTDIKA